MAAAASKKVVKKDGSPLSELEARIGQDLEELAGKQATLKDLKALHISGAREVELEGAKKAVLIAVPFPLLADFRKIHKALVDELEKKLGGTHVLLIANRTMVAPQTWQRSDKYVGVRPRSRTLTNVQDALLDDIVFPAEIVAKRTRVALDAKRALRVTLSAKEKNTLEAKLETFRGVYQKLTNKAVTFTFSE